MAPGYGKRPDRQLKKGAMFGYEGDSLMVLLGKGSTGSGALGHLNRELVWVALLCSEVSSSSRSLVSISQTLTVDVFNLISVYRQLIPVPIKLGEKIS